MMDYHNHIRHLQKEVVNLQAANAREVRREAGLLGKINRTNETVSRSKSHSTVLSKVRELERMNRNLASVQKKKADISAKIARRARELQSYEDKQTREDEKNRKRMADQQEALIRKYENHQRRVIHEFHSHNRESPTIIPVESLEMYDFFISHANEDKDGFVRELAKTLQVRGAKIWYDEFTLKIGDSLRQNIDLGLSTSHFGIVVLSEYFFAKPWTNKELNGLVTQENKGHSRILPIWHKVTKDEVSQYSPILADKVALNTSLMSMSQIVNELMGLISEANSSSR